MTRYEVEFYAHVRMIVEAEDVAAAAKLVHTAQQVIIDSPCPRTIPMPCGLPDAVVKLSPCTPRIIRVDEPLVDLDPGHQCVS